MEDKLAYLAGLLDGEGSINLIHTRNTWCPTINILNCDGALMMWLVDNFGGFIQTTKPKPGHNAHHTLYRWWFKGMRAIRLLHEIFPLLIIKRDHARAMFRYEGTRLDTQRITNVQRREHLAKVTPIREGIKEALSEACKTSRKRKYIKKEDKLNG